MLQQSADVLKEGGRIAIITFHSLEDRIVKHYTRDISNPDTFPSRLPMRAKDMPVPKLKMVGKAVRCSDEEIASNPRARSAVMRVAERMEGGV